MRNMYSLYILISLVKRGTVRGVAKGIERFSRSAPGMGVDLAGADIAVAEFE